MLPPNTVDGLGNDRGDYSILLTLHAATARQAFHTKHGFCEPAERRYVKAAIRRQRVRFQSRQRTHEELFGVPLESAPHPTLQIEGEIEARDALFLLHEELTHDEFDLLMRLGLADGNVAEVWNNIPDQGTRQWFTAKVKRLRRRASAILRDFYFPERRAEAFR